MLFNYLWCLLSSHRDIRELTCGGFSSDMTQINLSGERNKSGKNRIVPVAQFIIDRQVISIRSPLKSLRVPK